ncbi:hypothetical protein ABVN64_30205 [Mycolicibacterium conceptionense]|uniref:hypothetical protein n=1 Tax=Mycolicibacterium conceptionense TaxID=451644 RepID=UPI00336B5564
MTDPAIEECKRVWQEQATRAVLQNVRNDLQFVDGILGLLHHRGLVDTEQNRADVETALEMVQRYTR